MQAKALNRLLYYIPHYKLLVNSGLEKQVFFLCLFYRSLVLGRWKVSNMEGVVLTYLSYV